MPARGTEAIKTKKRLTGDEGGETVLSTGYRVKITPVTAHVVEDTIAQIPDPPVPMWPNPDKDGRLEPNPSHPDYIHALAEADRKRGNAVLDAILLMGVELLDGLPEDGRWLKRLKLLERRGSMDLSGLDPEDEIDREFMFLRYVAVGAADLADIMRLVGVRQEDIEAAEKSFPGDS